MANRVNVGNKYLGVKSAIKPGAMPEEPKITPEQVVRAFQSFNLPVNDRGNNHIGYWSTRPQSEGPKLMAELHKRRQEMNSKEDEDRKSVEQQAKAKKDAEVRQNESKQALGRLNDNDIHSLYDEYGIPTPDPEWVRNHMPNDPKKVRSILEVQRKATDDMFKKHTKNMVNSVPEIPKASAMPAAAPQMRPNPMMASGGMGGPAGTIDPGVSSKVSPFFIGDHSIVRIANPNNPGISTLWLVDSKKKILRPFISEQAFQNAFEDPAAAEKSVVTLSSQELGPGGSLDGFKPMGGQHGIQDDGSMPNIDFSPAQIQKRYGKPSDQTVENKSLSILDGVFNNLSNPPQSTSNQALNDNPGGKGGYDGMGGPYGSSTQNSDWESTALSQERGVAAAAGSSGLVDPNYIAQITADPAKISFYVNALAYGGYTVGDILNDIKRSELASKGDGAARNLKLIDPEMKRSEYIGTSEGSKAYQDARTLIPTSGLTGSVDPEILKYGINMPTQVFKKLVPIFDINSQEFKDAVDNVKSAFYDLTAQQLQAGNEQEKAVADYNYQKFVSEIERQYGVQLSNDATQAWKQIEALGDTYNQRGIQGSGLQNEAVDDYLKSVRKQDNNTRAAKLSAEETQMASTYKSSATPAQIQALIAEDQAKGLPKDQWRAVKWGLVPSADMLAKYDMANLKAQFPNQTEEELKAYRDAVLDENGNYRSTIYQNYYDKLNQTRTAEKSFKQTQVLTDSLNKENEAYRNYVADPNNPFSVTTKKDTESVASQNNIPVSETVKEAVPTPYSGPKVTSTPILSGNQSAIQDAGVTQPQSPMTDYGDIQKQLDAAKAQAQKIQKSLQGITAKNKATSSSTPGSNSTLTASNGSIVSPFNYSNMTGSSLGGLDTPTSPKGTGVLVPSQPASKPTGLLGSLFNTVTGWFK